MDKEFDLLLQTLFGKQKQASEFNKAICSVCMDMLNEDGAQFNDLDSANEAIQRTIHKRASTGNFEGLQWFVGPSSVQNLQTLGFAECRFVVVKPSPDSPKVNFRYVPKDESDETVFSKRLEPDRPIVNLNHFEPRENETLLQRAERISRDLNHVAPTAFLTDKTVGNNPFAIAVLVAAIMLKKE